MLANATGIESIDLTNEAKAMLGWGKTRMSIRLSVDHPLTSLHVKRAVAGETGLVSMIAQQNGFRLDLFDEQGGRIAEDKEVIDMRSLPAGTYFVNVIHPFHPLPDPAIAPTIEIVAPRPGTAHPASDRDKIEGGEGSDILVGRGHLDRIFGQSGVDGFVAEAIEVFDLVIPEYREDPPAFDHSSIQPPQIDPVVFVPDIPLAVTFAEQLNIPVTDSYLQTPLLHLPIYASDLNMLTRLVAADASISDLEGVQHATNLRVVNLAGNNISDISPIQSARAKGTSAPIGWRRAEYVALDGNFIGDIGAIDQLLTLKGLSLDYNAVTDLSSLDPAKPRQLEFLSIDGRPLSYDLLPGSELYSGLGRLARFVEPTSSSSPFGFGSTIATLGNRIIVGSPFAVVDGVDGAGAVHIFDSQTGELIWTIENPDPDEDDSFGESVAAVGDRIVIGASYADRVFYDLGGGTFTASDVGGVYFYDATTLAATPPVVRYGPRFGSTSETYFGESVTPFNGNLIVSASGTEVGGFENAGAIHVLNGTTAQTLFTIEHPEPAANDWFGETVTVAGNIIIVGTSKQEKIYAFDGATGRIVWEAEYPEVPGDFGYFLAGRGNRVAVGAREGFTESVYILDALTGSVIGDPIINPDTSPPTFFGTSGAWVGDNLLVGAPLHSLPDQLIFDAGAAYLFDLSQTPYTYQLIENMAGSERMGTGVAAVGPHLLFDAPGADAGTGAVYLHEGSELSSIDVLAGIDSLQWLSLSGNQIDDVSALVGLSDLSHLYLHDNRISDITPLTGGLIGDNGDPGYADAPSGDWISNINPVDGVYDRDYRFHGPVETFDPDAKAVWEFTNLPAGSYEVLATWFSHDSNTPMAEYSIFDGDNLDPVTTSTLSQQQPPSGALFSGVPWEIVATAEINDGTLRVELPASESGIVIADAIQIRPSSSQPLEADMITLGENPLDNLAHTGQLDLLDAATGNLLYDDNLHAPELYQYPPRATTIGGSMTLFVLPGVTDQDGDPVFLTAESSVPDAFEFEASGTGITITHLPSSSFTGTAVVTVTAHDGPSGPSDSRGRTDTISFDVTIEDGAIYGNSWQDLTTPDGVRQADEPGLPGAFVFVDQDLDGQYDASEPMTYTDANGDYSFGSIAAGSRVDVYQIPPAHSKLSSPPSERYQLNVGIADIKHDLNFGNFRVIQATSSTSSAPASIAPALFATKSLAPALLASAQSAVEGSTVNLISTISDPDPSDGSNFSFEWSVVAGNGQVIPNDPNRDSSFVPNNDGIYTATLTATDNDDGGRQYVDTVIVTVKNAPPSVDAGPDQDVDEGQRVSLSATVTDFGLMDQHTYDWQVTSDNGQVIAGGQDSSFSFTPINEGTYTVNVKVSDGTDTATDTVVVTASNVAPTVTAGADQSVIESDLVTLTASVTDEGILDTHMLIWEVQSDNGQVIPMRIGTTFSFTPIDDGVYTVTATATDDAGAEGQDIVVVTVDNADPSNVNAGPDQTAEEGATVHLLGTFSDVGTVDTHTMLWQVSADNGQVIPDGTGAGFSFVPTDTGTYIVTFTVTDDDLGSNSDQAVVTVTNVSPSEVDAGEDQSVVEGATVNLRGTYSAGAADDTHTLLWQVVADNGQIIPDGTNADFSFVPTDNGTYTVTFAVTDDDNGSASDQVIITVGNLAPSDVDAGTNQSTTEGTPVNLQGTYSDAGQSDTHTVLWHVDSDNGQVIPDAANADFSFVPTDNGKYIVTFSVTDDDLGTTSDEVVITVWNLSPSDVNAGADQAVMEGTAVHLQGTFSDAGQADTHKFKWQVTTDTGQIIFDGSDTVFSFVPPDNGIYTATFTVTDDDFGTASDQAVITVENVPPSDVDAGPDQTVTEGMTVQLLGTFSDAAEADTHTRLWQVTADNGQVIPVGTGAAFSFVPTDDGTYTATFTVSDDDGGKTSDQVVITVENAAPSNVEAGSDQSVPIGKFVKLRGTYFDAGRKDTHALVWEVTTDNGQVVLPGTNADFTFRAERTGIYTVTFTVTDDDGDVGVDTLNVIAQCAWQNALLQGDVNGNGFVTANDALIIINELSRRRFSDKTGKLIGLPGNDDFLFDVNGDGFATALDALNVINSIDRVDAEGEQRVVVVPSYAPMNEIRIRDDLFGGFERSVSAPLNAVTSAPATIQNESQHNDPESQQLVRLTDDVMSEWEPTEEIEAELSLLSDQQPLVDK